MDISWRKELQIDLSGKNGKDGGSGADGWTTEEGVGTNGERGMDGKRGADGKDVTLWIKDTLIDNDTFIWIDLRSEGEPEKSYLLTADERMIVDVSGGNGGKGGRGGKGGDGFLGENQYINLQSCGGEVRRVSNRTGEYDGQAGWGGIGGNGGEGGDAGKVVVHYKERVKKYLSRIEIINNPGKGGKAGRVGMNGKGKLPAKIRKVKGSVSGSHGNVLAIRYIAG